MSDRKVRDLLAELDRLALVSKAPSVMSLPVRDVAENLRRAVDAPDTPQIIHTVEELEALDGPVWVMCRDGIPTAAGQMLRAVREYGFRHYLPAVVVLTNIQFHDALKSLEEA